MEFSTANDSNPNRMIDPQFLHSFGNLQLEEQFGPSNSERSTTFNHNHNQDSIKNTFQSFHSSVFDNSNVRSFATDQTNRGNFQLVSNNNSNFQDSVNYGNLPIMDSFVPSYPPMGFDQISNHQSNKMERLLFSVQGSVSWLMVNQPFMFQELLDLCVNKHHLNLLVKELFSDSKQFIESMFTKQGSISVQKLIKKVKDTTHAFKLTELLAERFYDMATHYIARYVILECFKVFGIGPNHVLYIELIGCHRMLAVHVYGCNTLKGGIDSISGDYRTLLLDFIAKFSDYLSHDPYGNFVVQHVLELRNNEVNDVILEKLKGQFVSLAQKKRGSHVVEKCMETSENGLIGVVKELLQSPNSLSSVAKDPAGSYIVQKALDLTKRKAHVELYESLVENLIRQAKEVQKTPGGRHVFSFLRHASRRTAVKCNNSC